MRRFIPLALGLMIAVAPVQPVLAAEEKDKAAAQTIALEAVALPIIVDLGQSDTGTKDLAMSAEAMAQGPYRLARGRNAPSSLQ